MRHTIRPTPRDGVGPENQSARPQPPRPGQRPRRTRRVFAAALVPAVSALLFLAGPPGSTRTFAEEGSAHRAGAVQSAAPPAAGTAAPGTNVGEEDIQVPPPPLQLGLFPCSGCHSDMTPNPTPRALSDPHEAMTLKHGEERWCLDCHNEKDRDRLHLVNGSLVEFEQSYRLCGQCHGDKYRDWKVGVHGKRTGSWNGKKLYLLCVNCHDPHQPKFKPLQPLPPPARPEDLKAGKGANR